MGSEAERSVAEEQSEAVNTCEVYRLSLEYSRNEDIFKITRSLVILLGTHVIKKVTRDHYVMQSLLHSALSARQLPLL